MWPFTESLDRDEHEGLGHGADVPEPGPTSTAAVTDYQHLRRRPGGPVHTGYILEKSHREIQVHTGKERDLEQAIVCEGQWMEEEDGTEEEEEVDGRGGLTAAMLTGMNGRDSGIHLDDETRFDASSPELCLEKSGCDWRLAQSTSDLSLYTSASDAQLTQSSPELLTSNKRSREDLLSPTGRASLREAQRHSEYFSEEEEEGEGNEEEEEEGEGNEEEEGEGEGRGEEVEEEEGNEEDEEGEGRGEEEEDGERQEEEEIGEYVTEENKENPEDIMEDEEEEKRGGEEEEEYEAEEEDVEDKTDDQLEEIPIDDEREPGGRLGVNTGADDQEEEDGDELDEESNGDLEEGEEWEGNHEDQDRTEHEQEEQERDGQFDKDEDLGEEGSKYSYFREDKPLSLGRQIYKSSTFFDLSQNDEDDDDHTPATMVTNKNTFHQYTLIRRGPTSDQEQLNEQLTMAQFLAEQEEEEFPSWLDDHATRGPVPRTQRLTSGPDSYLDETELLGAAQTKEDLQEAKDYIASLTRPRDFWAEEDEGELGEVWEDDERDELVFLDDELLLQYPEREARSVEEEGADGGQGVPGWYHYYFVEPQQQNPAWVANFSPCPGQRPIADYRFFQPGYLEVIAEDDETVTALSENETRSGRALNNKTMDATQTTFDALETQKTRENGVQREDSGIVMEPEYKDQNEVIMCNKKPVTNGCDVSTGDEDEGSGSHGNIAELIMNGDKAGESESDLNDSASERHDATTDTQSDTENDSELLIMGQEEKGGKPKKQTTTVILTTKEYLANGHCRTIIETTRTVRDENGKESASKEIRIETTEPPMPQLKEEDESVDAPTATTTTTTTVNTQSKPTGSSDTDDNDEKERPEVPELSLTAATPPLQPQDSLPDSSSPTDSSSPSHSSTTQPQSPDTQSPPAQIAPEPCPEPEPVPEAEPEVAIVCIKNTANTLQSAPAPAETTTTTKPQVVEVVTSESCAVPLESLPPPPPITTTTIAAEVEAQHPVVEETVVAVKVERVKSAVAPRKPERTPSVREPIVVVTDPVTESAVLQNNNSLLPCDKGYLDANVIADLVYRRFRPNVAKRKLVLLLFPPPYQDLGEPVEEPMITPVKVTNKATIPPFGDEDGVRPAPEENEEKLQNATGEACPESDDDGEHAHGKRKRNPNFFRRVVRAVRRAFNRG